MVSRKPLLPLLLLVLTALPASAAVRAAAGATAPARPAPPQSAPAARPPLVVFLGDSLTAGLGLGESQAYPALLANRLAAQGRPIRIVNAGVSGDTTAGGLRRLDWLLRQRPDVMVVGLGANDALRGAPLSEIDRNLREIVRRCRAAGAQVLLLGMRIPPNYGPDYTGGFRTLYQRIAKDLKVPLVPFLLEGVGGNPELNQADGIHPTAVGQRKVADTVLPYLRGVLEGARAATGK
ncbi:MAG TPA: arylesterase [Thermoanaerobaculia bacterium]|nr:arylesterase [Thermoanaerobaculia bacterium]